MDEIAAELKSNVALYTLLAEAEAEAEPTDEETAALISDVVEGTEELKFESER